MGSRRLSYFIIFTVTHATLTTEATRPEAFCTKSDLLVKLEACSRTVELDGVEVIPYVEEEDSNFIMKQMKPQVQDVEAEALSMEVEAAVESETVNVAPIVDESKLSIKRKSKKNPIEGVSESFLSVKVKPSHEQEADDVVPIVEEEDERDFSIKRKPDIEQVEDIALEWPQLIESPANETESGIYDASIVEEEDEPKVSIKRKPKITPVEDGPLELSRLKKLPDNETESSINDACITKDEVREKGEPIASEFISSTSSKPFGPLSDETTVQTESITVESGVVAKPRKKSIIKTVEELQSGGSNPFEQVTSTVTRKMSKKNTSKKGQSSESVAASDLKRKSSKL